MAMEDVYLSVIDVIDEMIVVITLMNRVAKKDVPVMCACTS